jgi:hypothetical protein
LKPHLTHGVLDVDTKGDLMSVLNKLKEEMQSLEERFLDKAGQSLSAILDPSKIPSDISDLAAIEHGRVDSPNNNELGDKNKPEDEKEPEAPKDEKEPDADVTEEEIQQMEAGQVKEALNLSLDIAFECVEKADMILKALVGGKGKADLKDIVDEKMLERANDVAEEFIELTEYMEEVESDGGAEPEEEPEKDDTDIDSETNPSPEDKSNDEEEPEEKPEEK